MKKIIIDKAEGIAEVIDRILNEPDKEIALVIPNGSTLGRTVSNFHLLKREAASAGRTVVVESVDENILALARETGIDASHPLWRGVRGSGGFSDIVPRGAGERDEREPVRGDEKKKKRKEDDEENDGETYDDGEEEVAPVMARPVSRKGPSAPAKRYAPVEEEDEEVEAADEEAEEEDEKDEEASSRFFQANVRRTWNRVTSGNGRGGNDGDDDDDDSNGSGRSRGKIYAIIGIVLVLLIAGFWLVSAVFDHATVTIDFQKQPWAYQGNFTADKAVSSIDPVNNVIPAQVFNFNKDVTQNFPASGQQNVSLKATGMITIYNDYNTSPQELVATTRFLTPAGQIFRITKDVTVPGGTMVNGALQPGSVTAPIVADQAGPSYNIGPVAKLTVPGFDNSPRENGFYGTITASTTGGYTGMRAVPTAADISAAEASTTAILQSALSSGVNGSYPNNFKILDGATSVQIGNLSVNTTTDSNGNFSVFGEATLTAIGFDESAFTQYLLSLAQAQEASSTFNSINLSYGSVTANFSKGTVSFALTAQGQLEPAFSADDFKSQIAGESINAARAAIAALPQLSDGEISVWPSWLWSIPSNTQKITVNVN